MLAIGSLSVFDANDVTFLGIKQNTQTIRRDYVDGHCWVSVTDWHIVAHVSGALRMVDVFEKPEVAAEVLAAYAAMLGMVKLGKKLYTRVASVVGVSVHSHDTEYIGDEKRHLRPQIMWYSHVLFRTSSGGDASWRLGQSNDYTLESRRVHAKRQILEKLRATPAPA